MLVLSVESQQWIALPKLELAIRPLCRFDHNTQAVWSLVINLMKLFNLAMFTWASYCFQMICRKSSLLTSEQLMVAVKDSWHYRQLEIAHLQCNSVCHWLPLAWQLKIALHCPKSRSVHCLGKQHIQYWLAAAPVNDHDWIWCWRGTGIQFIFLMCYRLVIYSLLVCSGFRKVG